jgi:hypothetical protein
MPSIEPRKFLTRWITNDLLESCAVSLPITFTLEPGALVEIELPDRRIGILQITKKHDPDRSETLWCCKGSKYDGRTFDLEWDAHSDIVPLGHIVTVPVIMTLVTE